jgi:hypothetical protein
MTITFLAKLQAFLFNTGLTALQKFCLRNLQLCDKIVKQNGGILEFWSKSFQSTDQKAQKT